MKILLILFFGFLIILAGFIIFRNISPLPSDLTISDNDSDGLMGEFLDNIHPLSIENLRKGEYPGSELTIEQELSSASNYDRFIASYRSEGLKQYGLLTVPTDDPPPGGFPAIIFNHGYIAPSEYRTTERYLAYTDGFSRNGYVLFRPDYRGHGNSEGEASGAYGSNDYVIDVLNAVATIKGLDYVNSEKIGMWGHSMGGFITLRSMVVNPDIKAGVIWAGVVGPYPDLFLRNQGSSLNLNATPRPTSSGNRGGSWRRELIERYGSYEQNTEFWDSLSALSFASDMAGPVQFHHGTNDTSVPYEASVYAESVLQKAGKSGSIFLYPGDDHNISSNFSAAMNRSIDFFDTYLK